MMKAAHNPTFQERPEAIDVLSVDLAANIFANPMPHRFVLVIINQIAIAGMLVRSDKRDSIGNRTPNKTIQCSRIGIFDYLSHNHSLSSDSADHSNLAGRTSLGSAALSPCARQKGSFIGPRLVAIQWPHRLGRYLCIPAGVDLGPSWPKRTQTGFHHFLISTDSKANKV